MSRAATVAVGLAVLILATDARAEVRVIDGDTLAIDGQRIRLHAIDAPEVAQTCRTGGMTWACGQAATTELRRLVGAAQPDCRAVDRDRYRRVVAVCFVGGVDLGRELVRRGLALAYRKYGLDYIDDEGAARALRLGVWATEFAAPWEWRAEHKR